MRVVAFRFSLVFSIALVFSAIFLVEFNPKTTVASPPTLAGPSFSFLPRKDFATGSNFSDYSTPVDLNKDGKLDLVFANNDSSSVGILYGNGDTTFQPVVLIPTASDPSAVAVVDLDNDTDLDLVVTRFGYSGVPVSSNSVQVLLNNGNNTFATPTNYTIGSNSYPAVLADLNKDGKLDIIVPSNANGLVGVALGNGNGTFGSTQYFNAGASNPVNVEVGDFNGDSNLDVAVASDNSGTLTILLGNGTGGFANPSASYQTNARPYGFAVRDFNGDGKLDLLAATGAPQYLITYLGNGNGTFTLAPGNSAVSDSSYFVLSITDFNNDGKLDVVRLETNTTSKLSFLAGNGDGTFSLVFECSSLTAITRLSSGDFNKDGLPDVVATTRTSTLGVYFSSPVPQLSVSDTQVVEGNSGTRSAVFTATLTGSCCAVVTATYATNNGTATLADNDYVAASGTITFASGVTSKTISITINSDTKIEPNETFSVTLSNPVNATLAKSTGVGTIINDDNTSPVIPPVNFGVTNYASGGTAPDYNVPADFNGDGKLDIAVVNRGSTNVGILLGNGDGTFQPVQTYVVNGNSLASIEAGDFDGDGDKDLVVTSAFSGGGIYILRNNGSGAFTHTATYAAGSNTANPNIADLNGDGKLDIVVANNASSVIGVFLGNGDGTFQPQVTYSSGGINPVDIALADFDGDGKLDAVVSNDTPSSNLQFLKGNGNGTLQAPVGIANLNGRVILVDAVDVNGDGKLDLLVAAAAPTWIYVLLGNGNGTFNLITPVVATSPKYSLTADFNGDGLSDVAWLDYPNNRFVILLGRGDGTFEFGFECTIAGTGAARQRAGDFNGDGKADLVISNESLNRVEVILSSPVPQLSVSDTQVVEGNSGTRTAVFTATLSGTCCAVISATYATSNGTATLADSDYVAASGTLSFAPGITSRVISVTINSDTKIEANETFSVTLSNPVNATLAKATGVGIIINDDGPPPAIPPVSFASGINYGIAGTNPEFSTVADFNKDGKLDIAVANSGSSNVGILLGNGDGTFQAAYSSGVLAGTNSFGLVAGDVDGDGDSDLIVTFKDPSNKVQVLLNNGSASFTSSANYAVGSHPTAPQLADLNKDGKLDLVLANNHAATIQVLLGNGNGTFQAVQSFNTILGSPSSIAVGDYNQDGKLDAAVSSDASASGVNVIIMLGNGNGTFQSPSVSYASGTLAPSIATNDLNGDGRLDLVMAAEAPNRVFVMLGNGDGTFNPGLQSPAVSTNPHEITLNDYNADGVADVAWIDFPSNKFVVMLGQGDGTFRFGFECILPEQARRINSGDFNADGKADLVTSNYIASNVTVLLGNQIPVVSISDTSLQEGDSGLATATFSVTLSSSCCNEVTVKYATSDLSATVIDQDYKATYGTLTFAPGETTKTVTVSVQSDTHAEQTETFRVNLCAATNATIGKGIGTGAIQNDDAGAPSPPVTTNLGAVNYYTGGCNPEITTLSDFNGDGKIDIAVANSNSSNIGILIGNGDGTFQPAAVFTSGPQPFAIKAADIDGDSDQDLVVTSAFSGTQVYILRNNGNAVFQYTATYTVGGNPARHELVDVNGDNKPDIIVPNNASGTIGVLLNNGDGTFQGQVTCASGGANPIDIATGDFNGDGKIDLAVVNDEPASNLVFLINNGNGTFQSPSSVFTLSGRVTMVDRQDLNGDGKLDVVATAGLPARAYIFLNNGNATFTQLTTVNPTPTPKESILADFNADMKTDILWLDYPNNKYVVMYGKGDGTFKFAYERTVPDKVLHINAADLNNDGKADVVTSNYTSSNVSVLVTVPPTTTISVSDATAIEGNAGTTNLVFSVNLADAIDQVISVTYTTQDATATVADNDYDGLTGLLTFQPGESSRLITVTVRGDTKIEPNETLLLNLSNPVNAGLGRDKAVGTIISDDLPTLSVADSATLEGTGGANSLAFTLTLSVAFSSPVSVKYTTEDVTATAPADYAVVSGTLTFAPGELSKVITVPLVTDANVEFDETFNLKLSNVNNAALGNNSAVGTILNDDTVGCNPLNVTAITDDGSGTVCGTLSHALAQPAVNPLTISFALTTGNTINFTGNTNLVVKPGVTLDGGVCGSNSPIILDGTGLSGDGLRLSGSNLLRNLWLKGFGGKQLDIIGLGNKFKCSKVSRN